MTYYFREMHTVVSFIRIYNTSLKIMKRTIQLLQLDGSSSSNFKDDRQFLLTKLFDRLFCFILFLLFYAQSFGQISRGSTIIFGDTWHTWECFPVNWLPDMSCSLRNVTLTFNRWRTVVSVTCSTEGRHISLSSDQLRAASLIGWNAVTWLCALSTVRRA